VSNPQDNTSNGCSGSPNQQDTVQGTGEAPGTNQPSGSQGSPNIPNGVPSSGGGMSTYGGPPNGHHGGPPFSGPPPFGPPPWGGRHPNGPGGPPFGHGGPPGKRSFFPWHGPPPGVSDSQSKAQDNSCERGQNGQNGGNISRADRSSLSSGSSRFMFSKHNKLESKIIAHAVLASLAFLGFFPVGAISIRLFSFPGVVWFHTFCQISGQILFTIAFALGVDLAQEFRYVRNAVFIDIKLLLIPYRWIRTTPLLEYFYSYYYGYNLFLD
jgi:hypothetical protein